MVEPKGKAKEFLDSVRDGKCISVFGARRYSRWTIFAMSEKGVLIESDYVKAREAYNFIKVLTDAAFLPDGPDAMSFWEERKSEKDYDRADALSRIATGSVKHVVTYCDAAMRMYPLKEDIASVVLTIEVGSISDPLETTKALARAGYRRREQVSSPGEFSVRGDILDIYSSAGEEECYRVEFEFDEVAHIKKIDLESQTAEAEVSSIMLPPLGECFYSEKEGTAALEKISLEAHRLSDEARPRFSEFFASLETKVSAGKSDIPFLLPYLTRSSSFGEFVSGYDIFYGDAKLCYDAADMYLKEHQSRSRALIESGDALTSCKRLVTAIGESIGRKTSLGAFHTGLGSNRLFSPDSVIELNDLQVTDYYYDMSVLYRDLAQWNATGATICLYTGNKDNASELLEKLNEQEIGLSSTIIIPEKLPGSSIMPDSGFCIIGSSQLFYKRQGVSGKKRKEIMVIPEVGDYVVHQTHGIGKCLSVETLNLSGVQHDYVVVGYSGGDILYLPVENLDSLSKYSFTGNEPKLGSLGSGAFEKAKQRVKKSIEDIAVNLAELYGKRSMAKGYVYAPEPALMQEFISSFPYVDTEDQAAATEDALKDLSEGRVMDRLLCGDVGFGKTEVALRVSFRVISEGKQVAFLCPTTILALQHFNTAKKRMEQFGIRIAMLSRMLKPAEADEIFEKVERGEIDLVIGTHKLLSKRIKFKDLGLLVLDEEQRFGVAQKERLKELRNNINVFAMSATPIPRTLHMSLSGIRDISTLTTAPFSRLPVQTFVSEYSDGLLSDAITKEHSRGGQTFIVFNRVAGIEDFADRVRRLCPRFSVDIMHGRMKPEEAEKAIEKFAEGKTDVLVATTIIENGIDIPRANCMIVINADTFGLSQMYQLRGRVGRGNRLASVYFTYESSAKLSGVSMERLDAIMQCKDLGSGFMLAMRDLEIRGAGNILGREQHGHMEEIGYETYMKLLKEVMKELHGIKSNEPKDVTVSTDYPAYIPEEYVPDREWRMRQYKSIASIVSESDLRVTQRRLTEVYGPLPEPVKNLLAVALCRNLSGQVQADRAILKRKSGKLVFFKASDVPENLIQRAEKAGGLFTLGSEISVEFRSGPQLLKFLCNYIN